MLFRMRVYLAPRSASGPGRHSYAEGRASGEDPHAARHKAQSDEDRTDTLTLMFLLVSQSLPQL